ncbi:MAG: hypothetical protein V3T28_11810 [Gemmatimonadales bacterium]
MMKKGGVFGVLLRQAVVEAIEAGTMRRAAPDLMSLFTLVDGAWPGDPGARLPPEAGR